MPLILAGIDEAGYGPTLGPLAVGLSVFRVRSWDKPETSPNLWNLLSTGVCREPGRGGRTDKLGRVAIADSKRLKLSNSVKSTHPLVHLERGVLSFARLLSDTPVTSDEECLALLGTRLPEHRCYGKPALHLPLSQEPGEIGVSANTLSRAMHTSGVELLALRCALVGEREFNAKVREFGNKASTSAGAIADHLRHVWERWGEDSNDQRLGIVCDRLGGRAAYAGFLRRALGGEVEVIEESEARSRYVVQEGTRRAGVAFLVEGESAHLPVALASMIAKYARELAMIRFNRYWSRVYAEFKEGNLRPTAGYALDARRWLDDMGTLLSREDREHLVRIA
jgi:hypothetical protein